MIKKHRMQKASLIALSFLPTHTPGNFFSQTSGTNKAAPRVQLPIRENAGRLWYAHFQVRLSPEWFALDSVCVATA
jgi:hypothetical protein